MCNKLIKKKRWQSSQLISSHRAVRWGNGCRRKSGATQCYLPLNYIYNPTLYNETWTAVLCLFDITARVKNKYKCLGNRVLGHHSHIQHITVMYCWHLVSPLYLPEDEADFGLVSRGILRPTKSYLEADPSSWSVSELCSLSLESGYKPKPGRIPMHWRPTAVVSSFSMSSSLFFLFLDVSSVSLIVSVICVGVMDVSAEFTSWLTAMPSAMFARSLNLWIYWHKKFHENMCKPISMHHWFVLLYFIQVYRTHQTDVNHKVT